MMWRSLGGALLLSVLVSGCSVNYTGERLFWKAQRTAAPILSAKNSNLLTTDQYTRAIRAYQRVVDKAPGTSWAARSQAAVGSLYAMQKEFAKAREAYRLVLQNYNDYQTLVLNARLAIGKSYETEQDWDEAVKMYREISDYHPWSQVGLELPLYIGGGYQHLGKSEEAVKAYQRAVSIYTSLIPDAPTPESTVQVKGYLAQAQLRSGQAGEAVKTLEELRATDEKGTNRPLVLLMLGSVYQAQLHDIAKAGEAYGQVVKEFPDHEWAKVAKAQLERLGLPIPPAAAPITPAAGTPTPTPASR